VNTLAEPLYDFQHLIIYACAMADYSRGNLAAATAKINDIPDVKKEIQIAGVTLFIPDEIEINSFDVPAGGVPPGVVISIPDTIKIDLFKFLDEKIKVFLGILRNHFIFHPIKDELSSFIVFHPDSYTIRW
jgi:hypothetical protein